MDWEDPYLSLPVGQVLRILPNGSGFSVVLNILHDVGGKDGIVRCQFVPQIAMEDCAHKIDTDVVQLS